MKRKYIKNRVAYVQFLLKKKKNQKEATALTIRQFICNRIDFKLNLIFEQK